MDNTAQENYVEMLPIGSPAEDVEADVSYESNESDGDPINITGINIDDLPDGIVTGSNMLQFDGEKNPALRSAAALSLLAAQRVAANDKVIANPDQWLDRHNTVLENLNWTTEASGSVDAEFKKVDVAVHEAIVPFLTAALGPAAAAGSIIIKAIEQLDKIDENTPWITLFEREARHFDISEYQFSLIETTEQETRIRMAAMRFDVTYGKTQILFFKIKKHNAKFLASNSSMIIPNEMLVSINKALKAKLDKHINPYIKELDVGEI